VSKLQDIADYLIDQRDEPWPNGSESKRLHYWRDKAILAARRMVDHQDEQAERIAALEDALSRIAAFVPKPVSQNRSHASMDNAWNRAGEYAAGIARAALKENDNGVG
jgi:hypothetical protein